MNTDSNSTREVVLGDVDGNGILDAVFANSGLFASFNVNRVCLGDGAGGFTCSDVSTDTNDSWGAALGDVDGNGTLDAVFANTSEGVISSGKENRVCLGDGAGSFTCSDVSTDANHSFGTALGDVDGDGNLDAVFANFFNTPDRVCLGDGAGGFTCSDVSGDLTSSFGVALSRNVPTLTSFSPTSGKIGTQVDVFGTNLINTRVVTFNGVRAVIDSIDPSGLQVRAIVPSGATSGPISVTTLGGTATSATNFVVPSLTLSPPSGAYVTTQGFDLTLIVDAPGLSVVSGIATLNGADVTSAVGECIIPGTLLSGGVTFRCPGLTGGEFGPGTNSLTVTLDLDDASSVSDTVTWEVLENTEP